MARKRLDQPSALATLVTVGFKQAAQEAVARARAAGIEPAGLTPEEAAAQPVSRAPAVSPRPARRLAAKID